MEGKVLSFNTMKGFGFIKSDEKDDVFFVHYSEIVAKGFKNLSVGDKVSFDFKETPKGLCALNVKKLKA